MVLHFLVWFVGSAGGHEAALAANYQVQDQGDEYAQYQGHSGQAGAGLGHYQLSSDVQGYPGVEGHVQVYDDHESWPFTRSLFHFRSNLLTYLVCRVPKVKSRTCRLILNDICWFLVIYFYVKWNHFVHRNKLISHKCCSFRRKGGSIETRLV
jgi:hypothetical protein